MKRKISYLIAIAISFTSLTANAQLFGLFKKKAKIEKKEVVKKTPYEKLLTDKKCETYKSTFMTLHKSDGKLYVELPVKNLGCNMLVSAVTASVSNPTLATVGNNLSKPLTMRFVQKDSSIVLEYVNNYTVYDKTDSMLSKSVAMNYSPSSMYSFKVSTYNNDSTAIVFDMTSFFLRDNKYYPVVPKYIGNYKVSSSEKSDLAFFTALKAFESNIFVKVSRSYSVSLSGSGGEPATENYPATFQVAFTFLKLPDKAMVPRISDTRIGLFLTGKTQIDKEDERIKEVSFVNRWRVEPSDSAAYTRGELTAPTKPIVYYIDDAFPTLWKEAVKAGVLRWNKAFEKIGFKDVVQVRDFPHDNPEFDPDNLKYSCIRFIPKPEENAMGPSWIDPRSGEIINASVFVYGNVAKLINKWRFVQTSQIDPQVRAKKMPDNILKESLEYVVAHEVGHTLGFMHNMAASSAYPTDSLRSASFTAKYGTTPSIMDYARFNYVAQPSDKGVALTPPFLGAYDYYLVEWTYKPFIDLKGDYKAESEKLNELVEKHAHDPLYRYVMQQVDPGKRFDPSAIEEDLSNNPIKASEYGLSNLNYILKNMEGWIKDDEDSEHKVELYNEIAMQAYRYISNVSMNVGGILINQASEKSGIPRYKVLPKALQKEAALWLFKKAKEFPLMANSKLEQKLYAANRPFEQIAPNVQRMAINGLYKISVAYYLDQHSYSPMEYCSDMFNSVFEKTLKNNEHLTTYEMALQKVYIDYLISNVSSSKNSNVSPFSGGALLNNAIDNNGNYSLEQSIKSLPKDLQNTYNDTFEPEYSLGTNVKNTNFGNGYGTIDDIWIQTMSHSIIYLYHYANESLKTLSKGLLIASSLL
jgi:hypothetical protein